MSSNSVPNHARDQQIGLPLSGRPILLSRIGLHSVLLPLQHIFFFHQALGGTKELFPVFLVLILEQSCSFLIKSALDQ